MPRGVPNSPPVKLSDVQALREVIFLQALRDVMITLRLHTDDMLRRKIGPDRLTDATLEVFAFMESGVPNADDLSQNEKVALACQLLRSLSKYITNKMNMPVTPKTLIDCISLLGEAVDLTFPGYWGSKLLRYTILPVRVSA